MPSVQELNEKVQRESASLQAVVQEIEQTIVGQKHLLERLLIALLCNSHVLIEGLPGLAKTLTVRTLAGTINAHFQRIQFTPDLLPSDVIGTQIYNPRTGEFTPKPGPIFSNIILADEINRAPAKVQSALLEAMEERQVTLGDTTHPMANPFMVLATQNPIEQEGTYPLPEAQLDRFMLKVIVEYPSREEERLIMDRMTEGTPPRVTPVMDIVALEEARRAVDTLYVDERIKEYVLDLVFMTRDPAAKGYKNLDAFIEVGASPRATIFLIRAAKALAFLRGRGYVTPGDIKSVAPDILRHRIILTFEAEAENISSDQIIQQILGKITVP